MADNNDALEKAQQMLKAWGAWLRSGGAREFRLSFPHSAPFTHAGEGRGDRVPPGYVENHDAEAVEKMMVWLKGHSYENYLALECRYVNQLSVSEATSRCRCSMATYQKRCSAGEWMVVGTLIAPALNEKTA